ncbi:PfkB family carbohydrate kinase [Methanosphaera sp.]|uniref:PfkB family carbohydrate kinase n=1 Tax=Methanosphaera sp. TaxID=2666342 RepID=UPI002E7A8E8F|nr:PfkB family carbohydrate kinase [Methanosphaera sp.]MEE1117337.1 PfkB family carbohydrate kinase [Methanosphaera sp.]
MNKRILAIGPVTKDYVITPQEEYFQIGGAVFYQTLTLTQLKCKVSSIISIANEDTKFLEDIDADINYVFTDKTMEYTNIYDEKFHRKQKAILPKNPILPKDITVNLNDFNTVLLSPLSPYDIPVETITYFKENNIRNVLIPQGFLRKTDDNNNVIERSWDEKNKYLKNVDIICLDENEAKKAFNLKNINNELILKLLKKYTLEQIIITKAEQGSTIYTKNNIYNIPAIKTAHAVDATGLGDTYIAAYIAKLEESNNIYESGLFASIAAKEKLENKGPLKSSKEKIEKELNEYR